MSRTILFVAHGIASVLSLSLELMHQVNVWLKILNGVCVAVELLRCPLRCDRRGGARGIRSAGKETHRKLP